ncbi:DesA/ISL3 alpha bundle tail domain-containing protein, partial [Piscirickettsia litoralis]
LRLQALWSQDNKTQSQLVSDLQAWCQQAESEASPAVLSQFGRYLRRYRVTV